MFCCTCAGSCCHAGPHSYCAEHGPRLSPFMAVGLPIGWTCPRCHAVWAPYLAGCANCGRLATPDEPAPTSEYRYNPQAFSGW